MRVNQRRNKNRHKAVSFENVIHKMRNGFYASRHCLYQREIEIIEARINGKLITDEDDIAMLETFGFEFA
jgi:hypothetical protein